MSALTPSFVMDLESRMRYNVETEYNRLTKELWSPRVVKRLPVSGRKEVVTWLLSTASIDGGVSEGQINFEDIVGLKKDLFHDFASKGLSMQRSQLEDLDANGVDVASKWASDIGALMAYWPQKLTADLILSGEGTTIDSAYDALAYFHNAHPSNPLATGGFTYANLFTGAAASTPATDPNDAIYPGAAPIDASVTVDAAFNNLAKVLAYILSIKMPNGLYPRMLKPVSLYVPPSLYVRAQQLVNARFIAQAASSGGGSGDVSEIISNWGMGVPVQVLEFASDPTTYYIGVEELSSNPLGAFIFVDREPFRVTYYTGQGGGTGVDAVLDRANQLEWHVRGRNSARFGHPYLFHKIKAT